MDTTAATRKTRIGRPAALLAALSALGLSFTLIVGSALAVETYQIWLKDAHQGANSETFNSDPDCGSFETGVVWHFVLNKYEGADTGTIYATFQDAGELSASATTDLQKVQHFYINTPDDDILVDAYVEVLTDDSDAELVLSHVCDTGDRETPSASPSESESAAPSESESAAPSEESAAPSESESAAPSEESAAPSESESQSPEGSVLAGTGTPAPSLPDGAMTAANGPSPLPTVFFGLILLASLATLAWVNVKAVRSRA